MPANLACMPASQLGLSAWSAPAGRIEVSRAFGDRAFKKQGMSSVPDVQAFQISGRDAFLLLACDGFWGERLAHHQLCCGNCGN